MTSITHPLEQKVFDRLRKLPDKIRVSLVREVESVAVKNGFLHRVISGASAAHHPIALSPFVVPKSIILACKELARAVYKFQLKLPKLYLENVGNIRSLLPLSRRSEQWLRMCGNENQQNKLLIRLDTSFGVDPATQSLYPILFETNSTALAGLYNHTIGTKILKSLVFPRVLASSELSRIQAAPKLLKFAHNWIKKHADGGIAFVEDFPIENAYGEIPRIVDYFRNRGVAVAHGHPTHLLARAGSMILNGARVSLVYRDVAYKRIPQSGSVSGFASLVRSERVIPGIAAEFGHKGILECLTSEEFSRFFTDREQKILKKSVPWTRVIYKRKVESANGEVVDLTAYIKQEKRNLVIKPNLDAGGAGVVFGKDANNQCWQGLIQRAIKEPGEWVVQRVVDAPTKKMVYLKNGQIYFADCHFTFGIFYYPDKVGLHCRISPFKVANVARGGSLACVFIDKGQ